MPDTASPARNVWRTRALEHCDALAKRGHVIALQRLDYPQVTVVVKLNDRTPFVVGTYRNAASKLATWLEVLDDLSAARGETEKA
jgi:hypothetical protein